jgi:D-arabinose 1-dehydrogenase-like Zn-dependent alcohol dehydrogenase
MKCKNAMNIDGKLVTVGAPTSMTYSPFKLIFGRKSIHGSPITSNGEIRNMLEFCAKHNIVVRSHFDPLFHVISFSIHYIHLTFISFY